MVLIMVNLAARKFNQIRDLQVTMYYSMHSPMGPNNLLIERVSEASIPTPALLITACKHVGILQLHVASSNYQ